MNEIGDEFTPVYRFEWNDGSERLSTDRVPDTSELRGEIEEDVGKEELSDPIEILAMMGRNDPECEVELIDFE